MNQLIVDVTEATFTTEIEQAELPVLIDFWAPWCGPCKMIQPILEDLARMYQGCIKFTKVNADENKALTGKFSIRGLPTLLLLKDGQIVERAVGLNPQHGKLHFAELLDKHVEARSPQPARPLKAFNGVVELKRSTIERVRAHINAGQIHGVDTYSSIWPLCDVEANRYSLFGAALHGTVSGDYEGTFGIPDSVGLLEDVVHNYLIRTSDVEGGACRFFDESDCSCPIEWLEAIPVGADLSRVTPHFLHGFLLDLADEPLPFGATSPAGVSEVLRDAASMHARLVDGDVPSRADWRAVRAKATGVCPDFQDDPVSWGLATCAEKLAWAPEDLGTSIRNGINAVFSGLSMVAIRGMYSVEGWVEREAVVAAVWTESASDKDTSDIVEEAKAVRARHREAEKAQMDKLKLELGRKWHRGLMQSLQAVAVKRAP